MKETKINIATFLEVFNKEYAFLYDNRDNVVGYYEALLAFDDFASKHKSFVTEFVNYRGDFVSSDREAVAFMFAMGSMVN